MLPTIVNTEYADVFLDTSSNQTLQGIALVLFGLAFLVMIASMFSYMNGWEIITAGAIIACIGGAVLAASSIQGTTNESTVMKNMVANVQEKYHADLKVSAEQVKDLDKYQTYTLSFDNGAEGQYKIKFEKTGEPIIADPATAPSSAELNEDTVKSSPAPSPKAAPSPAELEASAKK